MTNRPNIVLIMSDQHRASVCGYAGDPHARTPNLDRLANEGVAFDNAYCPCPLCVPSRQAFMTGLSTQSLEVWSLSDAPRGDLVTWPEMLETVGYETVIAGRMHLCWADKKIGFRRRLCGDARSWVSSHCRSLWDGGKRSGELESIYQDRFAQVFFETTILDDPDAMVCADDSVNDHAFGYLEEVAARSDSPPFALCVGYVHPHPPMRSPRRLYDHFKDMPVKVEPFEEAGHPPFYHEMGSRLGRDVIQDEETVTKSTRAYYAMTEGVDERVGRLINQLERLDLLANTVVIYTSDHGEMLGERGWWGKRCLYDGSAKVPLLIRDFRDFREPAAGRRCSVPVSLIDLFPTLLALGEAQPWREAEGDDLTPLLDGSGDERFKGRAVFSEFAEIGLNEPTAMVRVENHKLIAARNFQPVLFQLKDDPEERGNLYGNPDVKEIQEKLETELRRRWDPERTRRKVLSNQWRTEIHDLSNRLSNGFVEPEEALNS